MTGHKQRYDWQRGWVAPDGALTLSDEAWLPEQNAQLIWGGSEVVTLSEVAAECLMLLGEPGSGKSVAMEQTVDAASKEDDEDDVVFVDLGIAQTPEELERSILDEPKVQEHIAGSGRLRLYLDALDEAKIAVRSAVSVLKKCIGKLDSSRMVLRVSCRTAERQTELERWLQELFGESFKVLELCPLRRSEAREAAEKYGLNADRFLEGVDRSGAAPLAAHPLTLKMLIEVYADDGSFPDALKELYEKALLLMVSEHDDERKPLRKVTGSQAFAIAARIAAGTVLCGSDSVGDEGTSITDLLGGDELDRLIAIPAHVAVTEQAVLEVLNTGLFTARGHGLGWAHRTFGDFFAAYWLADDRLSLDQVCDLIMIRDATGRRVVPALRSVAGWLAALRPDFISSLDRVDAAVPALFGDPASISCDDQRAAVHSLLEAVEDREIDPSAIRSVWSRLGYDGLDKDLEAVLLDSDADFRKREAVVDAVGSARLSPLADPLVKLALDRQAPIALRTRAIGALGDFADDATRERIAPLAIEAQPDDVNDELKGSALQLCWPHALTSRQLFEGLMPEKNESLLGLYAIFLRSECAEHVRSDAALFRAVEWAMTVPREWHSTRDVCHLADVLVLKAWPRAAVNGDIARALADLVLLVAERHEPVLASAPSLLREMTPAKVLEDVQANRGILDCLVPRFVTRDIDPDIAQQVIGRYCSSMPGLMQHALERWRGTDGDEREAWAIAVRGLSLDGQSADALFEARAEFPSLYAEIAWRYEAIVLDSPEAEAMRRQWRDTEVLRSGPPTPDVDPDEFAERVATEMQAFVDGDVEAYWRMQLPLMADDNGRVHGREFASDLTSAPGWKRITPALQEQIIDGASRYLIEANPKPAIWLGRQKIYWPAWGGYCALRLLWQERRDVFDDLSDALWRHWASTVVGWQVPDSDDQEFRHDTLERIRRAAPNETREAAIALLGSGSLAGSVTTVIQRLGALWDTSMDDALFGLLRKRNLEAHEAEAVVKHLGWMGQERALKWAYSRLKPGYATDQNKTTLALTLAETVAHVDPAGFWKHIRRTAKSDPDWTRSLLAKVAERGRPTEWSDHLDPQQLGELFAMLMDLFPPRPESPAERMGAITAEIETGFWRSRILDRLISRVSPEAIGVLGDLEASFDEGGWIRRIRHRAREELRRATWDPPRPPDVIRLPTEKLRLLSDSRALREVVEQRLKDLDEEMRGAHPKAPLLWNTKPRRQPKTENEISNALAQWLREKIGEHRAFINREVQVNALGGSGDRTDLVIQAIGEGDTQIAVVVEVKGAWNKDLMTGMGDQLAKKYLKPDLTEDGIYLVLWFSEADWDAETKAERDRRKRATRTEPGQLQELLNDQADDMSRRAGVAISALVMDGSLTSAAAED
jgi:hypothetical protein